MLTKRIKLDPRAIKKLIQKRKAENRVYALSHEPTPGPTGCFADCCGCCDHGCPCSDEILAAMQFPFDFTVSATISVVCDDFTDCTDSDSPNTWTACPDPFSVPFIFNFCEPTEVGICGSYTLHFCGIYNINFYFYCCDGTWGYTIFFEGSQLGCGDNPLIPVLCTQYGTVEFEDCNEITAEIPFEFDAFRTEDLGGGSCLVTGTITITA